MLFPISSQCYLINCLLAEGRRRMSELRLCGRRPPNRIWMRALLRDLITSPSLAASTCASDLCTDSINNLIVLSMMIGIRFVGIKDTNSLAFCMSCWETRMPGLTSCLPPLVLTEHAAVWQSKLTMQRAGVYWIVYCNVGILVFILIRSVTFYSNN